MCPELDNVLVNLEFMPETLNQKNAAKVGDRQVQLVRKWHKAGVLSAKSLKAIATLANELSSQSMPGMVGPRSARLAPDDTPTSRRRASGDTAVLFRDLLGLLNELQRRGEADVPSLREGWKIPQGRTIHNPSEAQGFAIRKPIMLL